MEIVEMQDHQERNMRSLCSIDGIALIMMLHDCDFENVKRGLNSILLMSLFQVSSNINERKEATH